MIVFPISDSNNQNYRFTKIAMSTITFKWRRLNMNAPLQLCIRIIPLTEIVRVFIWKRNCKNKLIVSPCLNTSCLSSSDRNYSDIRFVLPLDIWPHQSSRLIFIPASLISVVITSFRASQVRWTTLMGTDIISIDYCDVTIFFRRQCF